MSKQWMRMLQQTSLLDGGSGAYLESLYESWLHDPGTVSDNWREYFDGLPQVNGQERGTYTPYSFNNPGYVRCVRYCDMKKGRRLLTKKK